MSDAREWIREPEVRNIVCTFCQDPEVKIVIYYKDEIVAGCKQHYGAVKEASERKVAAAKQELGYD